MIQVRLIDASFMWTEPHSKRIKVKLVVQKEVTFWIINYINVKKTLKFNKYCEGAVVTEGTRRPASADRTARAANFRRDLQAT